MRDLRLGPFHRAQHRKQERLTKNLDDTLTHLYTTPSPKTKASMSKLAQLASLTKEIGTQLETRADQLVQRIHRLKTTSDTAFAKTGDALSIMETSVQQAEDAINQLTNGGPPLE